MTPHMPQRIESYDIFRGFLLLAMVFYHILVNFFVPNPLPIFYWISTGFIVFLGVVVGQFLLQKPKQILTLFTKLFSIYLLTNLALIWIRHLDLNRWLQGLILGDQEVTVFEILLPMSFVLLLAGSGKWWSRFWPKQIPKIWFIVLPITLLLWLNSIDYYWYNLIYISYGLAGLILGWSLNLDFWQKKIITTKYIQFSAFFGFLIIIVLQIVLQKNLYLLTFASVILLYFSSTSWLNCFNKSLTFLGKNSLTIYIFHILLIKLIQML